MQSTRLVRIIFLIISLFVIFGGMQLYKSLRRKTIAEKQNELSAIISLKIEDLVKWRTEHIKDAVVFTNDLPLKREITNFLENKNSIELEKDLIVWMKSCTENYDIRSVLLLDNTKKIRLSFPDGAPNNSLVDSTLKKLDHTGVYFEDLHFSDNLSSKTIDIVVPLTSSGSSHKNIDGSLGTIIFRIDPEITLFPLIQSWPTPSKSSETLLLRREGDSVLFLNELRHQKNTALRLKKPLSNKSLPAAVAASGYEGVFEGTDYRNVPVISFLRKIPDSPWFMVAKVDKKELYAPLNELIIFISAITFLVIGAVSILIGFYMRNQRIRFYKEHEKELKQNELHLKELNATKDKFFSIIAHDLRSPFAGIICLTEVLMEKMKNKDFSGTEQFASLIHNSSRTAMELITNLTVWSRFQTGRMGFNPKETDIIAIIVETIKLLSVASMQKSIKIIINAPPRLNISVDKPMISSVIRNLISNSIKFSNPGGEIEVSVKSEADNVVVEVKDNGVGIESDQITKLFRIETSFSTHGTQNEEGTGLGLILCKEFISNHGGDIWVESEVRKGSKFTFKLPLNP
jgi:signal transduction histidine kinase